MRPTGRMNAMDCCENQLEGRRAFGDRLFPEDTVPVGVELPSVEVVWLNRGNRIWVGLSLDDLIANDRSADCAGADLTMEVWVCDHLVAAGPHAAAAAMRGAAATARTWDAAVTT